MDKYFWYRLILIFFDGTVWLFGPMMLITMFFGFETKTKGRVIKHMLIALFSYEVISIVVALIAQHYGQQVGVLNGLPALFGIIYWTINLKQISKIKAFFISAMAAEIVTITVVMFSIIGGFFLEDWKYSMTSRLIITAVNPLLWNLIIYAFSKLSCKKRKEPMSMQLIVVTFFLFVFVDTFLGLFGLEEGAYFQGALLLRIMVDLKLGDASVTVGTFILFLLMIVFTLIMIVKESESAYFRKKNTINEYYLEAQKAHYESLMESNREIRKIKHDMKNHLYVISELATKDKPEELKAYLRELEDNLSHADVNIHVGNEIADAILSEKQKMAESLGIVFEVDGTMSGIQMSAIDICTIFSNMIDNAIEATSQVDGQKWIRLSIKKHNKYLVICENNPCKQKLEIEDNSIKTTKTHGMHGFGLVNIKETVDKYDGDMSLTVSEKETGYEFCIEIVIASNVENELGE